MKRKQHRCSCSCGCCCCCSCFGSLHSKLPTTATCQQRESWPWSRQTLSGPIGSFYTKCSSWCFRHRRRFVEILICKKEHKRIGPHHHCWCYRNQSCGLSMHWIDRIDGFRMTGTTSWYGWILSLRVGRQFVEKIACSPTGIGKEEGKNNNKKRIWSRDSKTDVVVVFAAAVGRFKHQAEPEQEPEQEREPEIEPERERERCLCSCHDGSNQEQGL